MRSFGCRRVGRVRQPPWPQRNERRRSMLYSLESTIQVNYIRDIGFIYAQNQGN